MTEYNVYDADGNVIPASNTYALVKARFEQNVMSVRGGNVEERFFMIEKAEATHREQDLFQFLSAALLKSFCRNVFYLRPPIETGEENWTRHAFAPRWLNDDTRRTVTHIMCDPIETPEGAYNRWSAPRAARLPEVPDANVAALIEPFLRHVREVLVNGDAALAEFVTDFVCNMIQRPGLPARVGLVFAGPQGCGKGVLFEFLRSRVLGVQMSYQTAAPAFDLLKQRSFGAPHKVLVQVDEGFGKHLGALAKTLAWETVTCRRTDTQAKTESRNLCNLICTTSHVDGGYIPPRYADTFVAMHCSRNMVGNVNYFYNLLQHLSRDDVARALYQFAMARDLSRYYERDFRRFTPAYLTQAASSGMMSRFMSALVNAAPTRPIAAHTLYDHFRLFDAGVNATVFGRKLQAWKQYIQKRRTRNGIMYRVDVDALRATLARFKEYHADAAF